MGENGMRKTIVSLLEEEEVPHTARCMGENGMRKTVAALIVDDVP